MSITVPTIQWYGERGIINAILQYITKASPCVRSTKSLLKSIYWANGTTPSWIQRIQQVNFIVEISLAQFGDPDLTIVCRTDEGQAYCIFIEAKVTTYRKSMSSITENMRSESYNSTINGQLSLKYRFAKALEITESANPTTIIEPYQIFQQYKEQLEDQKDAPRKLQKKKIIQLILAPLGLIGLKEQYFYYVTLTWDTIAHAFFNDNESQKPLFFDENGNNIYKSMTSRIGWIGYNTLEQNLNLGEDVDYQATRRLMLQNNEPDERYYEQESIRAIERHNVKVLELKNNLKRWFEDKNCNVLVKKGSCSIKGDNNRVIAKIIPLRERVYVGFKADLYPQNWCSNDIELHQKRINGVTFQGIFIEQDIPLDTAINSTDVRNFFQGFLDTIQR